MCRSWSASTPIPAWPSATRSGTRSAPCSILERTRVVVLSESSKAWFSPRIRARTRIIPNPVQVDCARTPVAKSARPQIVALGRFGPEKGFDRLIDAFSRIAADFPEWDLVNLGRRRAAPGIDRPARSPRPDGSGPASRPHDNPTRGAPQGIDLRPHLPPRRLPHGPGRSHGLWTPGRRLRPAQRPARHHPRRHRRRSCPKW